MNLYKIETYNIETNEFKDDLIFLDSDIQYAIEMAERDLTKNKQLENITKIK